MVVVRRGIAYILDFIFLSLFFFPITYLYSGKWIMGYEDHLWGILDPICLVFLFIIFAYFIFMEAYIGWTVGKKVLGMRVVDETGNKIGWSKSLIRNLLRLVDGLPALNILGIILIARSPEGQRFGDRIARTFVCQRGEKISSDA
ncbi:MAG: RDD family protein [Dehalococcoidales bacterium]|nr:RDD family protein [Dehalococcoidales bacterium]